MHLFYTFKVLLVNCAGETLKSVIFWFYKKSKYEIREVFEA